MPDAGLEQKSNLFFLRAVAVIALSKSAEHREHSGNLRKLAIHVGDL